MLASLIGCTESEETGEETTIFEIANTEQVIKKGEKVTLRKHFMILNPPKDLVELKERIEAYINEHPIEREIKEMEGNTVFYISFYRESKDLPRDWQPNERYMNTDRLEHHKNDLIASVIWSGDDPAKRYNVYDKSKDGTIIKRMHFKEDQLVE